MIGTIRIAVVLLALTTMLATMIVSAARAQDVTGIELCNKETRMDRRTGCLQSNVEFLQGLITKNAADAQQKLKAAAAETAALKGEVGALKGEVAALKAALAAAQASIDKLQETKRAPDKPAAKTPDKPAAK